MYKYIYKLHFKIIPKATFQHYYRAIMVLGFQQIIPLYFWLTSKIKNNKLSKRGSKGDVFLVSLTTFPTRIDKVWLTIESILRQEVKPDRLVLWLYKDEFNGKNSLPKNLLKLEKRGLEIKFCKENLMPHKKYFYTMQLNEDANIITIDDDIIYPPDLIKKLIISYKNYPKSVTSIVARSISKNNTGLKPYIEWKHVKENTEPRIDLLPIGMGGVLYPSKCLNKEVYNIQMIKDMALRADDLWLKVMGLLNKVEVVGLSGEYTRPFFEIAYKENVRLTDNNVYHSENDETIEKLLSHYKIPISIFDQT